MNFRTKQNKNIENVKMVESAAAEEYYEFKFGRFIYDDEFGFV